MIRTLSRLRHRSALLLFCLAALAALAALAMPASSAVRRPDKPATPLPMPAPLPPSSPASPTASASPITPVPSSHGEAYSAGQFVGPASCAASGCHGNVAPSAVYGVLQNEFSTWFHDDKHRRAFDPLWSARSAQIARNMKLPRPATESAVCLECHALSAPKAQQARALEREDGISCESCHGAAGGWLARHNESGWSHADSVAAGMVDLKSSPARARLCLSCHLGDRHRQVDHELIAAGHPELVFELDNYTAAMPRHWTATEAADTPGMRVWALGQVESFQHGFELLASRAQSPKWPEFAELTCDTCHHDLKDGAWRQRRGYKLRAGLPSWSPARYAVLRHLLVAATASGGSQVDALDGAVQEVAGAVSNFATPPATVVAASSRAAQLLGQLTAQVEQLRWSAGTTRNLLAAILADRDGPPSADRESAEQTALAIQSIAAQLSASDSSFSRGRPADLVRQLFGELDHPYEYDRSRFVSVLTDLAAEVDRRNAPASGGRHATQAIK